MPGLTVADQLRDPGDAGGDDRELGGHRLHEHDGQALLEARQAEHVGLAVLEGEVVLAQRPHELDDVPQRARGDGGGQRLVQRPGADHADPEGDAGVAQLGHGVEQDRPALLRDQATDIQNPQGLALGPHAALGRRGIGLGVDRHPHDVEPWPHRGVDHAHELAAAEV